MDSDMETTSVVICGCGPTGAMLSTQLGRAKIENICLEREEEVNTDPRGIALDEDGIRALQGAGLYNDIYSKIGRCMGNFNFVGGTKQSLWTAPFMKMDYATSEGGTGHVGFICHKQPVLEQCLRRVLAEVPSCQLRTGCSITSISEDRDWVYVKYTDRSGAERKLRARFMVGADGKTGYTRKKYLEPRGVLMKQASATSYEETWVALNWKLTLPTPDTHPQFPLWKLGYTPEQVYDQFFPTQFRFLCNPERPAVCGRFGLPNDRFWRFEFVVKKGEDGARIAERDGIKEIVYPYITHPGKRYNLPAAVQYPEDCIETLRARPFVFSARSCNKWALGRVILCGDAAHVFPPFGGQGIVSGFRDACSLAWYLQIACRDGSSNHASLLRAWYMERKQQLEKSLAATVENGKYVTESNPIRIFVRNTFLWLVQLVPSWRRWLEQGARREGMCRYNFADGMLFLPALGGGLLFPQVYCVPLLEDDLQQSESSVGFTDDVIFATHKTGLFQLVVLADGPGDVRDISEMRSVDQWSDGHINATETTFIVQNPNADPEDYTEFANGPDVVRIATSSEFAAAPLCSNRPEPLYYDEYRLKNETGGKKFIVLRGDRFVFAACADLGELERALRWITPMLERESKSLEE